MTLSCMELNPWILFYIGCRYPAVMIPIFVEQNNPAWRKITGDLIALFHRPYCSILQNQFEQLTLLVKSDDKSERKISSFPFYFTRVDF